MAQPRRASFFVTVPGNEKKNDFIDNERDAKIEKFSSFNIDEHLGERISPRQ